ncbi:MAG: hypothetical protein HC930_11315 [Hydrococcus sp. SU_1_0]|nr:hypothetical protein [Hydrococcus sp. SU_1_0]
MWLILSEKTDIAALWVYQGLKDRGLSPLEWITPQSLTPNVQWDHRLGEQGKNIQITLADGRKIDNETIQGVINRLVSVPFEWQILTHPDDREYAIQELTAFYISWLYALPCPMLNRPTPQGLSGQWRHPSEWFWLAAQAGLPTLPYRQNSDSTKNQSNWSIELTSYASSVHTVFVVGERVLGVPFASPMRSPCQRLARLSGTQFLGIDFAITPTKIGSLKMLHLFLTCVWEVQTY